MVDSIDRRQFLLGATGCAFTCPSGFSQDGEPPRDAASVEKTPRRSGGGSLRAIILIDGVRYTFDENDGEDLGDFIGPDFVQRCIRVIRADLPLTVFFRPDRDSDRVEVVFELGRLWGPENARAANLDAYDVRITRGAQPLADVHVPRHWWFSAWRWQSAVRSVFPIEKLQKYLPPFGRELIRYCHPTRRVHYTAPMDSAGICKAMPTAGDRPDIGLVTEWQAEYLLTRKDGALGSMLAQAEAAGSVPWHMRDERTGAPLDIYEHPTVHWKTMQVPGPFEYVQTTKTEWNVDDAHQPALAYIPYLLTADPYYLEKLQFQGTWNVGWALYHRNLQKLPVLYPGETRAYAWSLRTLAQLAALTPEQTPKWLLPQSYWRRVLDDNLTYFTREFVHDPEPESSIFRAATRQDLVGAWQEDYLAAAMGWAVLLGHKAWRPVFEWKVGSTIALCNGKSGWPRQWCTPYYYKLRAGPKGPAYQSWGEAWKAFKASPVNKVVEPFPDEVSWVQNNSFGYIFLTRAVLAMATQLEVSGARECFEFVEQMAVRGLRQRRGNMDYRWALTAGNR